MWQYSSSGSVCGVSGGCDVDVYNGTTSQFTSQMVINDPGTGGTQSWSSVNGGPIAMNTDGTLEIFGVGTDGAVWHDYQTSAGGAWNGWISMSGATMDGNLAVANGADGRLDLYACHSDGHVWHNFQVKNGGGAWNGWGDTGVPGSGGRGGMCIGINPDGRLEVFVSSPAGVIYHRYQNTKNGAWTPWYNMGGSAYDQHLFCGNNQNGALQVFAINSSDTAIWTNYQTTPGGAWNGWFSMGNAGIKFYYGQP